MSGLFSKTKQLVNQAKDFVEDKVDGIREAAESRGPGKEPEEWSQIDRTDSVRSNKPAEVDEGPVSDEEWNNWHYNRRIVMGYTSQKPMEEVMKDFVHSNKFLTKWEAKSKRLAFNQVSGVLGADESALDLEPCDFGQEMREKHFAHIAGTFLNSASYGCTPDVVFKARQSLEVKMHSNNVLWRFRTVPLRVREAEFALANNIKADPDDLTFIPNANYGSNAVLKSQPWEKGDILIVFSCDYEATLHACRFLRWNRRIEVVTIEMPLPASDDEIIKRVRLSLEELRNRGKMAKMANFCHVTSKTAWIFPAKRLTELFHKYGVSVLIDGAQAAGHIDINIGDIKADYYIGTMHKWMYTCPGVAFLVVQPLKQKLISPLVVSYFYEKGFIKEFSYTGLMDFTGYISAKYAVDFVKKVCGGYTNVRNYCHNLAEEAVEFLTSRWGTICIQGDPAKYGSMPIIQLPFFKENPTAMNAATMMVFLLDQNITSFVFVEEFRGKKMLVIRLAVQIFHSMRDFERLSEVVLLFDPNRVMASAIDQTMMLLKQA